MRKNLKICSEDLQNVNFEQKLAKDVKNDNKSFFSYVRASNVL